MNKNSIITEGLAKLNFLIKIYWVIIFVQDTIMKDSLKRVTIPCFFFNKHSK